MYSTRYISPEGRAYSCFRAEHVHTAAYIPCTIQKRIRRKLERVAERVRPACSQKEAFSIKWNQKHTYFGDFRKTIYRIGDIYLTSYLDHGCKSSHEKLTCYRIHRPPHYTPSLPRPSHQPPLFNLSAQAHNFPSSSSPQLRCHHAFPQPSTLSNTHSFYVQTPNPFSQGDIHNPLLQPHSSSRTRQRSSLAPHVVSAALLLNVSLLRGRDVS